MVDFFDKKYSGIKGKSSLSSIIRFSMRLVFNIIGPLYLKLTYKNSFKRVKGVLDKSSSDNPRIIISLTSFPGRISKIWMVVECMLRQTTLPDKIILYLAATQFPNKFEDLPKRLKKYLTDINFFEVVFVEEDIRSHKKYFYSFQEFKYDNIILIDDDIFYPSNLIQDLMVLHTKYPQTICSHRSYRVFKNGNTIEPYNSWELIQGFTEPSFDLFHTSGGGTLYQPSWFDQRIFDLEVIKLYCSQADDVWLNIQAQLNKIPTLKSNYNSSLLPIIRYKDITLKSLNLYNGGNDKQLFNLIEYYNLSSFNLFNSINNK